MLQTEIHRKSEKVTKRVPFGIKNLLVSLPSQCLVIVFLCSSAVSKVCSVSKDEAVGFIQVLVLKPQNCIKIRFSTDCTALASTLLIRNEILFLKSNQTTATSTSLAILVMKMYQGYYSL